MIELPQPLKKMKDEIRFKKDVASYRKKYEGNTRKLMKYKNIHKGKRIFILATGPSINKTNLKLLKDQIVMGVNSVYKKYPCTYYAISDKRVLVKNKEIINKVKKPIFFSSDAAKYYFTDLPQLDNVIALKTKGYMTVTKEFSKNAENYVVGGHTVVIDICLQLAYYMGAKEVYLIGCDSSYEDKDHFDNSKIDNMKGRGASDDWGRVFDAYEVCKKAFEADARKIYNATVGGKLEVFERKKLEEII